MREKEIEAALRKAAKKRNGMAFKFVSPGLSGVPDRLVLLPEGRCIFVELKRPGEKPRKVQVLRMKQLRKLGFKTYVADSYESIDKLLDEVMAGGV